MLKKNPLANTRDAGDVGSDPWVEKILWNRKWKSTPVFFLENPMNRGAWWATAHGFTRELGTTELLSTNLKSAVIQHSSASRILKLRNPDPPMKQKVEKYLNILVNRARKT